MRESLQCADNRIFKTAKNPGTNQTLQETRLSSVFRKQIVFKEGTHPVAWVAHVGTSTFTSFLQLPDKVDSCSDSYRSQLGQQASNWIRSFHGQDILAQAWLLAVPLQ